MKRRFIRSTMVGMLLAAFIPLPSAAQDQPRPAKIVEVTAATGKPSFRFPGVIQAVKQATLTFPVSGRLVDLPVVEGQKVAAGAVIARLEEPRFSARLASSQAEYDKTLADFRRAESLFNSGNLTRRELDSRRAAMKVAQGELNAAKEDVAATIMKAPFSGIVARRYVEAFQNIQANESVVTLQDLSAFDVLIYVPTRTVLKSDGSREASVSIEGIADRFFPASVRSVATEPDPATQTYAVLLRMERPAGINLLPGMAATVQPVTSGRGDESEGQILLAPIGAVAASADGSTYVWRVDRETGEVERRPVAVGGVRGDSMEVLSGLTAGDWLIGAGLSQVQEGMKVRPIEN